MLEIRVLDTLTIPSFANRDVTQEIVTLAIAGQGEAEAGTDNAKVMTPLRTAQAIQNFPYIGPGVVPRSNKNRVHWHIQEWCEGSSDASVDHAAMVNQAFADAGDLGLTIEYSGFITRVDSTPIVADQSVGICGDARTGVISAGGDDTIEPPSSGIRMMNTEGAALWIQKPVCKIDGLALLSGPDRALAPVIDNTDPDLMNMGLRIESAVDDMVPTNQNVDGQQIHNLLVYQQPGAGIVLMGRHFMSEIKHCKVVECGEHALVIGAWAYTGRATIDVSGGITRIDAFEAYRNGGHQLVVGHPLENSGRLPRVYVDWMDGFTNGGAPSTLLDPDQKAMVYFMAERSWIRNSTIQATPGSGHFAMLFGGRGNDFGQNSYLGVDSTLGYATKAHTPHLGESGSRASIGAHFWGKATVAAAVDLVDNTEGMANLSADIWSTEGLVSTRVINGVFDYVRRNEVFTDARAVRFTGSVGGGPAASYTIASGSITPSGSNIKVDTEAAAASDNLSTIVRTNYEEGARIGIRAVDSARTIVVDETGNIALAATTRALDSIRDRLVLEANDGAGWDEISFSDNAA